MQDQFTADEYYNLMIDELEDLARDCQCVLEKIKSDKERVLMHYNKKVVPKSF